jgi:hypothetical protein
MGRNRVHSSCAFCLFNAAATETNRCDPQRAERATAPRCPRILCSLGRLESFRGWKSVPLDDYGIPPRQIFGMRFWEGFLWGLSKEKSPPARGNVIRVRGRGVRIEQSVDEPRSCLPYHPERKCDSKVAQNHPPIGPAASNEIPNSAAFPLHAPPIQVASRISEPIMKM